ncbi:hypothetical protein KO02_12360 [Sphingobacterium sp. ML3W]|uniref:hypothetical protein n=1 Tax=Sphingobacterium sp. ML3W TaxID=1538644 RepID=UPI0004F5CB10|nr:hypothetical protein [Sphingobacterium sp. ML3W]AIM37396.1 hypothetical protein KO02_12360 [Sphingobacterium sp. ML3W]
MKTTTIQLKNNYVLIKPQGSYDKVTVGGIDLKVGYNHETRGRHVSIIGKVIKLPESLIFLGNLLKETSNQDERKSIVASSLQWDTQNVLRVGDDVLYDYMLNNTCETEARVVEIEGIGDCYLISYDSIFGYSRDGDKYVPINGYVFFKRDEAKGRVAKGDLEIIYKTGDYHEDYGTVIAADEPVSAYLFTNYNDHGLKLHESDRILVKKGHGFRIAYDIHASEELKEIEVVRRPNIIAVCNS